MPCLQNLAPKKGKGLQFPLFFKEFPSFGAEIFVLTLAFGKQKCSGKMMMQYFLLIFIATFEHISLWLKTTVHYCKKICQQEMPLHTTPYFRHDCTRYVFFSVVLRLFNSLVSNERLFLPSHLILNYSRTRSSVFFPQRAFRNQTATFLAGSTLILTKRQSSLT